MIESIDCLWLNMFLMSSFQLLHRYSYFLLIMTLNHAWVLTLFNSRKIHLKNEFIDSKKRNIVFTMKNIWKFAKNHMKKSQRQ
jgi:hypothetical protein